MRFTSSTEFETVDAADELDIGRAPGSVGAHALDIFVDGQLHGGVVPRQRQPDDARVDFHAGQIAERVFDGLKCGDQIVERQDAWIVVDLQRADARGLLDDAGEPLEADRLSDSLHERMDAEP